MDAPVVFLVVFACGFLALLSWVIHSLATDHTDYAPSAGLWVTALLFAAACVGAVLLRSSVLFWPMVAGAAGCLPGFWGSYQRWRWRRNYRLEAETGHFELEYAEPSSSTPAAVRALQLSGTCASGMDELDAYFQWFQKTGLAKILNANDKNRNRSEKALEALTGLRENLAELEEQTKAAEAQYKAQTAPAVATREIQQHIWEQRRAASKRHDEAATSADRFLKLGFGAIVVGLLILLSAYASVLFGWHTSDELRIVAPVGGFLFNMVGTALILLYKSVAGSAVAYYDRTQDLQHLLTSLLLVTNPILETKRTDLLEDIVRTLVGRHRREPGTPPTWSK